ncbi:hypothetical protein LLEC1_00900 [Akanthomyces lecanii]|uniref:Histidine kinase n=1 Tax=Cordyceps confragosa TaxID=2714763 RepID=A0A179IP62_CORDF|nr:hypothetical protein LLEC1_00900 [Akanthomyces lecanii]
MPAPGLPPRADLSTELDALRLWEILDADSRPTFVLDLDPNVETAATCNLATFKDTIIPVFCNEALRFHERLYESLFVSCATPANSRPDAQAKAPTAFAQFKTWAESVTEHDVSNDIYPVGCFYEGVLWTGATIRRRWRLISGNQAWQGQDMELFTSKPDRYQTVNDTEVATKANGLAANSAGTQSVLSQPTTASTYQYTLNSIPSETSLSSYAPCILLSSPEMAVTDWTVTHPKGLLSDHVKYARTVDWAKTPLGPMESWSREFRQAANLCMANPHPAALFWGSELTMLYNEAYAAEVAGKKHPSLMGTGFSGPFAELWDYAGPIFAECARTGTSVRKDYDYLPIDRKGILEETFYNWSFTPLYGGTDRILGFYNAPFETTQEVVGKRRMQMITRLGESTAQVKTVHDFWPCVITCFEDCHYDIPFAFLYSIDDAERVAGPATSTHGANTRICQFQGSLGVPASHAATPPQLDINGSSDGFIPSFRKAIRNQEATLLNIRDGSLPEAMIADFHWRGFGDPCRQAIVLPVRPTNEDSVLAVLVLGIAPRRIYDEEYEAFVRTLNRQLATSLASIILYESEVRRSREAAAEAAKQQELLKEELSLQANRMRRMTELSPLGMFFISPGGVLLEANDQFFEMTRTDREHQEPMSWTNCVADISQESIKRAWAQMHDTRTSWSGELLLKGRHSSGAPAQDDLEHWVLFTAHVETRKDGSLKSVMGSITDISHLKWAQNIQTRQLEEAEEMRRQQNEFIDITSHEIRNPLSAILQCADDISCCLSDAPSTCLTNEIAASCLEAAATISLCAQHQKLIVDDILTVSKLHSNLLQLTPSVEQPDMILRQAIKMFESEALAKDIHMAIEHPPDQDENARGPVILDPSRVLQILINLISNAIKFTMPSSNRVITVGTSILLGPPTEADIPDFHFAPLENEGNKSNNWNDWGGGIPVYVCFKVRDTGCGLAPQEQKALFRRFKQASPRTHARYGGSGLGLFISKKLTELHGGQIGMASKAGDGTTFLFYVQARSADSMSPQPTADSKHVESALQQIQNADPASNRVARIPTPSRTTPLTTEARVSASQERPLTNSHILVVEDNLINQKVLVKQLKKLGCQVSAANDGLEALVFLKKTHFCVEGGLDLSLILMDLEMPNMDGAACVREIRAMEQRNQLSKRVPVIAVTANVRDSHIVDAKEAGMDDIVTKPFSVRTLLERMVPWVRMA